jgi:hypothetical protein
MQFRDKIENLKENAKYKRIRQHIQDNQIPYSVAGGVGIGVVGMLLVKGSPVHIDNSVAPVFNNMPVFNNTVNNGGHMRKIVRCLEDDTLWLSVTDAAASRNVPLSLMSRHLNGHTDNVNGLHYVIEALATN